MTAARTLQRIAPSIWTGATPLIRPVLCLAPTSMLFVVVIPYL